eukprot:Cvel_7905.t1-p1 / transcript=Cvel_7905.t1 / gene=Cvel_7905 / organism=Chromera_velia_CCMP2878 / gene_product=hypothetical protein / transcript_product=hypothetical protein / location=Cvel_scaffold423:88066-89511(+) / protein_length=482 / sequence_SO=supercontig / SO=protein_coding / is_pseudo=false
MEHIFSLSGKLGKVVEAFLDQPGVHVNDECDEDRRLLERYLGRVVSPSPAKTEYLLRLTVSGLTDSAEKSALLSDLTTNLKCARLTIARPRDVTRVSSVVTAKENGVFLHVCLGTFAASFASLGVSLISGDDEDKQKEGTDEEEGGGRQAYGVVGSLLHSACSLAVVQEEREVVREEAAGTRGRLIVVVLDQLECLPLWFCTEVGGRESEWKKTTRALEAVAGLCAETGTSGSRPRLVVVGLLGRVSNISPAVLGWLPPRQGGGGGQGLQSGVFRVDFAERKKAFLRVAQRRSLRRQEGDKMEEREESQKMLWRGVAAGLSQFPVETDFAVYVRRAETVALSMAQGNGGGGIERPREAAARGLRWVFLDRRIRLGRAFALVGGGEMTDSRAIEEGGGVGRSIASFFQMRPGGIAGLQTLHPTLESPLLSTLLKAPSGGTLDGSVGGVLKKEEVSGLVLREGTRRAAVQLGEGVFSFFDDKTK